MNNQYVIKYIISVLMITTTGLIAGCDQVNSSNTGTDSGFGSGAYAEVIDVKPVTKTVQVPREVCNDVVVTHEQESKDPNRIVGTVTGAVIGGVLGNEIGSGKGNDAATVGGAVVGGYAGNQVQEEMQEGNTYQTTERKCETAYDSRQEPAGYQVTYRYDGADRTINLAYDPGRRLPMKDGQVAL